MVCNTHVCVQQQRISWANTQQGFWFMLFFGVKPRPGNSSSRDKKNYVQLQQQQQHENHVLCNTHMFVFTHNTTFGTPFRQHAKVHASIYGQRWPLLDTTLNLRSCSRPKQTAELQHNCQQHVKHHVVCNTHVCVQQQHCSWHSPIILRVHFFEACRS